MTLNQILDNVRYGEKYLKEKMIKEDIEKYYDKEYDIFYASKRVKALSGEVVVEEGEEKIINRIVSKLMVLEDRLETGKVMSDAYRKMQTASIMDDCTSLIKEATKYRKVDSRKLDSFAKIVTATKYFVESSVDENVVLKESENPLFNKIMKEEKQNLENYLK